MILNYIRAALDRGWVIFPLKPGSKIPATPNGLKAATADRARIEKYWCENPAANYGIACGGSGLVVIDCDTHGTIPDEWAAIPGITDGHDVLAYLAEVGLGDRAPIQCGLWNTFSVATPTGGRHIYYSGEGYKSSVGKLGPLLDVRADGGYVVGPGSVIGTRSYAPIYTCHVAPVPEWLHTALTATQTPQNRPPGGSIRQPGFSRSDVDWRAWEGERLAAMGDAPDGSRHHTFTQEIMKLALAEKDGCTDLDRLRPAIEAIGARKARTPREISDMIESARRKAHDG